MGGPSPELALSEFGCGAIYPQGSAVLGNGILECIRYSIAPVEVNLFEGIQLHWRLAHLYVYLHRHGGMLLRLTMFRILVFVEGVMTVPCHFVHRKDLGHILRVDIEPIVLAHDLCDVDCIEIRDTKSSAFVIHEAVKGYPTRMGQRYSRTASLSAIARICSAQERICVL